VTSPINLAGFAAKFAGDDDPWRTFTARDEAVKRTAILRAIGDRPVGRVLELASGNGSNSAAIARKALRLDATEGTREGVDLTARAVAAWPRACASLLVLPGRPPRAVYDVIVIAEILYYLSARDMARVAREMAARLTPGGTIVLAHHRIDFYDFVQHAAGIHARFLADTGRCWTVRTARRTGRWVVIAARDNGVPRSR
jgi:SAM-dependent methyltransferase